MQDITHSRGDSPLEHVPEDYSFSGQPTWFVLPEGRDQGKRLFFYDTVVGGDGTPEKTIVLVHGNPESSYVYRNIARRIAEGSVGAVRVVAMDHIGFGLSDQATYEMVSMDHAQNLTLLVRALDLRNVTLVIHDWGGPIGIGAFLQDPERVDGLVITNSTVFPVPAEGKTYARNFPYSFFPWSKTPSVVPDGLWSYFAIFAVFGDLLNPFNTMRNVLREKAARAVFKEQFHSKTNVRSSKRLVLQSAVWAEGNEYVEPVSGETRDTGPFFADVQRELPASWGPDGRNIRVRAVIGGVDALGKPSVVAQWVDHLPQLDGHVQRFERAGHFVVEEQWEDVASAILDVAELR